MNTCKNCKHQFELQHGTIQVCPLCGEQIVDAENTDELNLEILADEETIDLESIEEDDEFFELDESVEISDSAPTVDVEEPVAAGEDDSFEIIDSEFEIGSDSNQTELEPTFIGTQDPDYEDNLLLPRAPIGDDENTESIDSTPYAETEEGTINQDDESPEKTEVATEFFDPAEKQPTIELPDEEFSATSLDYAEREIIGLNAEENLNQDADYVISIEEDGSELGSGASGIVYKAIQKSLGRTVALKLLKKQVKADTQSQPRRTTPKQKDVEKFLYESQITAGLDHPNVITVHDLGVTSNDTLFYSMKLFEGGKDWSKDFDENSLVENLDIFNDVCDAMRRAHRDRITHRDLKPQNVLVGDFGEVQVTDWGLAIDIKIDSHSKISGGGTPCYMAPEMSSHYIAQQDLRLYTSKLKWTQDNAPENFDEIEILNEKIKECEAQEKAFCQLINEQSDVYVLGAILFQIAAGFPPHLFQISDIHRKQWGSQAGKNKVRNELLMSSKGKFANYIVKNLSNKEAREALRDIAEKAMRFQPRQRFESVAALQQAVRDFRDFMRCIEDTHRGDREVVNSKDDPKSYVNLNNAMYAYEGALENYPDYEPAHRGLAKARFLFAERALNNEDFELGLSTMTDEAIDQQPDTTLARQLQSELTSQRNRRDRRKRLLFIATMASLVSIAIGIAFGIYAAMAAQRANLAVRKAAEANVDLVDARKKVRTSKEKLTASLVDQKKAMADTIELSAQAATAELQKQLFDQKNSVSNSNAKIALLNSQ
ncbi:MAG: serine/threonine-protein kinase, partial [Planctomycetota bacterium]